MCSNSLAELLYKKVMFVKDYDIIKDITALFDKEIIIYGMGYSGREMGLLLEDAGIKIRAFCETVWRMDRFIGYPVINLSELKKMDSEREVIIIVASRYYQEEIIKTLQGLEIQGVVCTDFGVLLSIQQHINKECFAKEFREVLKGRREIVTYYKNISFCDGYRKLCEHPNAVLVYQPGKVGSTTIAMSLGKFNIDFVHIHFICSATHPIWRRVIGDKQLCTENQQHFLVENAMKSSRKKKIITIVRDPIARALSLYMQSFSRGYTDMIPCDDIDESATRFVKEVLEDDQEFVWFDIELKALTNIDIFEYDFDKEKGYAWIKTDVAEVLVLKMEQMNENEKIIGEFVGIENLKLVNGNIGAEKSYKYLYQEMKKHFRIPKELIEQQYSEESKTSHFYTKEERKMFIKKWEKCGM